MELKLELATYNRNKDFLRPYKTSGSSPKGMKSSTFLKPPPME